MTWAGQFAPVTSTTTSSSPGRSGSTYPAPAGWRYSRPGGTGGKPAKYGTGRIDLALFDLAADPGETVDVRAKHPDVVARLQAFGERMRDELGDGDRAGKGVRPAGSVR